MITPYRVELVRQAKRRRTLAAFLAVVLVPVVIVVALAVNGGPTRNPQEAPELIDVASSGGLNVALFTLAAMSQFLLVVVVALFGGDTISAEASWGSLRYLLTRPVTRGRLLRTKLAVAGVYALAATLLVPLVSLAAGTVAFGWKGVVTPFGAGLPAGEGVAKLAVATGYVAVSMATVAALAFMFSTMTDAPLGAVAGAVVVLVVSQILDAITALGVIRYGLPTHYWLAWLALLNPAGDTAEIGRGLLLAVPYTVGPLAIAWWWFHRKDVLS